MNEAEKFQMLIDEFAKKQYKGVYLYKYIEDYVPTYIRYSRGEEYAHRTMMMNDCVPVSTAEEIRTVYDAIKNVQPKDILFVMIQLRRPYKGKMVHTAFDSYISTIDDDKYTVIEPGTCPDGGGNLVTKNRIFVNACGIIGRYGYDEVDRNSLLSFIVGEYIAPIEKAFGIKFNKDCLLSLYFRCSVVMKFRSAYIKFYSEVLTKARPKVICYTHGADWILQFLGETAQAAGIPTIEIDHGAAIFETCYSRTLRYADAIFTYSDMLTIPSRANGWKNVYTVGKPDRHKAEKGNKNEKLTIVSFVSSTETGLHEMALNVARLLANRGIYVIYKMHSSEEWTEDERNRVLNEVSNFIYVSGGNDVREVYAMSDIVVGRVSTALVDALPFNEVKIVAISGEEEKRYLSSDFSFLNRLAELGDIVTVGNEEELIGEILSYEKGKAYRGEINHFWPADGDKRFREYIYGMLDGTFKLEDYE